MRKYRYKLTPNRNKLTRYIDNNNDYSIKMLNGLLPNVFNREISFTIKELRNRLEANHVKFDLTKSGQALKQLERHGIICAIIPNLELPEAFQD